MPQIYHFDSPNEEWKAIRRQYITATEAAALFQLGNQSIAAVAQDKLFPGEPVPKNEYMLIGNILEPAVLKAFELRAGIKAYPAHPDKIVFVAHDSSRLSATPDGKYRDADGKFYVVECKTTGSENPERAVANFVKWQTEVPKNYAIQVHTQMAVTGAKAGYIGCLLYLYPVPFIAYYIEHDAELEGLILEETDRFWKCIEQDKAFYPSKAKRARVIELLSKTQHLVHLSHHMG